MDPFRLLMTLCWGLLFTADAWGQRGLPPHIGHVYPAGGRQGTTFEVEIGSLSSIGALASVRAGSKLHVSGGGIQTAFVGFSGRHEIAGSANGLRKELQELMKKEQDAATLQQMANIRLTLAILLGRQARVRPWPYGPESDVVIFQVTLAPNAEIGQRELRLETANGLSNPLPFHVGNLPEFRETEVLAGDGGGKKADAGTAPAMTFTLPPGSPLLLVDGDMRRRTGPAPVFTLPAVVNGQIFPSEVDRFRFQARKGQQLVIAACARELKPYQADASPGWFQAVLTLYDAKGDEVAYNDDYRFHPDPVLFYKVLADGPYVLEIKDALYRGRRDFVYRMTVSEQPFITSIFPLGGRSGTPTSVKLDGWNLPATTLTQDGKGKGPDTDLVSVRNGQWISNRVPFAVDALPECVEREPNDAPTVAQPVTLPTIVNGRIDPPGDRDVFRFEGRAGEMIVAEVYARRLDSPLDSLLILTDANGKELAFNDDHEDQGAGLVTHHADSYITTTLPASGTYYLHLGDAQGKGGPDYTYRLRISPPRPDVDLRVVPSSIYSRPGATVPITVYVLRKDGSTDVVAVRLKDAPDGFKLSEGYVSPTSKDQIRFSLTVPPTPLPGPVNLVLEGRTTIAGRETVHRAVPADEMEQAFGASRHLVPAKELLAVVREKEAEKSKPSSAPPPDPPKLAAKILSATPILIPIEGTARLQVSMPAKLPVGVDFDLTDPPAGITVKTLSVAGTEIVLVVESNLTQGSRPGVKGNLSIYLFEPGGKQRRRLGVLPAIPFEVVVPAASPSNGKQRSNTRPIAP